MDFSDSLKVYGIEAIEFLQNKLEHEEDTLLTVSHLGNPEYAFTILIPIVASFNTLLAAEVLATAIISEWSNCLFKWFLMEDRPYWWIQETSLYHGKVPEIKQGVLTCETGPGSPSGHVTGTTAVLYVISQFLLNKGYNSPLRRFALRISYISFVCLMIMSRLYVAAHFPHQCILGVIIGYLIGRSMVEENGYLTYWKTANRFKVLLIVSLMIILTFGAYWLQKLLNIDPQWSILLAFKWCQSPENIHVNTTPLYSLVRDTGAALGLALISPITKRVAPEGLSPMVAIVGNLISCGFIHFIELTIPTHSSVLFYICHFTISALQPILLLALVPKLAANKRKRK